MTIDPSITMQELTTRYPSAQRALFRRYHVGGCSSCGFRPDETLAEVCARNENLPVEEVAKTILEAHEAEGDIEVTVQQAAELVKAGKAHLVDVRSREEWDAVHIEGSTFLTQEVMHEIGSWPREQLVIFVCHHGVRSLDAAAYFAGHGLENAKSMKGGIDVWSCEIDPSLPRYDVA